MKVLRWVSIGILLASNAWSASTQPNLQACFDQCRANFRNDVAACDAEYKDVAYGSSTWCEACGGGRQVGTGACVPVTSTNPELWACIAVLYQLCFRDAQVAYYNCAQKCRPTPAPAPSQP